MVYRRYGRRSYRRNRPSNLTFARQRVRPSWRLRRFAGMLNRIAESKIKQDPSVIATILAVNYQIDLPTITQGTGKTQRVGNKVYIKKMGIVGTLMADNVTTEMNAQVRVLFLWPKGPGAGGLPTNTWDPVDLDLYTVVSDRIYQLGAGASTSAAAGTRPITMAFNWSFPIRKSFVYNDSGSVSDIDPYIVLLSNSDDGAAAPRIRFRKYITFTDV